MMKKEIKKFLNLVVQVW